MPYNDATLDYIERSIEDERDKLEQLVQYRKQYEQEVKILNDQMAKGENSKLLEQPEVETLTQKLYSLKHYGKVLQGMGKVSTRCSGLNSEKNNMSCERNPHSLSSFAHLMLTPKHGVQVERHYGIRLVINQLLRV